MTLWRLFLLLLPAVASRAQAGDSPPFGSLTFEPLGYAVYPLRTRGAEATYRLSPDRAVSLSYAEGKTEQLLTAYEASLLLARYKVLIGSLSQLNAGFGVRQFSQRLDVATATGSGASTALEAAVVSELSFGTRFETGRVLLVCDWLGVALPLARFGSRAAYPEGVEASERAAAEDSFAKVARRPSLEFLRFSAGIAL